MDDEIPPVKEEIIVPVVVVDDDVCIDFVKEVLHKESLPVTKLNGYTQLMEDCDEIEIEQTRVHVKRKILDVQVIEHNTEKDKTETEVIGHNTEKDKTETEVIEHNAEKDKTETVVSAEKETCQPPIKM